MFDRIYIPGSFTPFHRGHMKMVTTALKNVRTTTGVVYVVMGTKGRDIIDEATKAEFTERCVRPMLENIGYVNLIIEKKSPVRYVYEELGNIDKSDSEEMIAICGSTDDVIKTWPQSSLTRYVPRLFASNQIMALGVDRALTDDVSASAVRFAMRAQDRQTFNDWMPDEMDKELAWKILMHL